MALGVVAALSLLPRQAGVVPHAVARVLTQGTGWGAPGVPVLVALVGATFFLRQRFALGRRTAGLLVLYLAALGALHLPSPPGREVLTAAEGQGGGYLGALLAMALRRSLGEPALWAAVILGAAGGALLVSGLSFEDLLRSALRGAAWLGRMGRTAARGILPALGAGIAAALRAGAAGAVRAGRGLGLVTASLARRLVQGGETLLARLLSLHRAGPPAVLEPSALPAPAAPLAEPDLPPLAEAPSKEEGEEEEEEGGDGELPPVAPVVPEDPAAGLPVDAPGPPPASPKRKRRSRVEQGTLPFAPEPARAYALPDLSLLDAPPGGRGKTGKADPEEVARSLERTLASFGVEARVVRWEVGPVVTRYELQPAPGVKVQKITSLQNDIALALAASSVRLEAPIPGKSAIGVELPNERPSLVHLREILTSDEFQRSPSPLTVAIGKGIAGNPVVADLVAMPHLLIAGATGSGKSVALNSMIASILFRSTPEQVRFLMIDPKRVELTNYNGIPHLLSPVVTGPREAAAKLRWAIQEMESRYELFAADGVRNIQAFNAQHPDRPLAYILIIIDELADLMMIAPADFEEIICRLAQMTRATGIHLVVATQRPSVDVITGLIKANIPSRIAFAVTSQVDSRTILDHPGAEKLLGRGDMLFSPIGATRPTRVQGAYISDAETERLVEFWRAQGEPAFVESLVRAGSEEGSDEAEGADALLADAARLVVRAGYASVSLLQRKMRIGYVRAARLVDQLEERGIVGPAQGSTPREVLVGVEDVERLLRTPARAAREA